MKQSDSKPRSFEETLWFDSVVEEKVKEREEFYRRTGRTKPQILDRSKMTREAYNAAIFAMQPESTRRTMQETDDQKAKRLASPVSLEAQVAKSVEEMAQFERRISPEEYSHFEATRRRPKNSVGQSELSATTDEKRATATYAYTFTPPAELTTQERARISQISPYSEQPPVPPQEKKSKPSWFRRLLSWIDEKDPRHYRSYSYLQIQEMKKRENQTG